MSELSKGNTDGEVEVGYAIGTYTQGDPPPRDNRALEHTVFRMRSIVEAAINTILSDNGRTYQPGIREETDTPGALTWQVYAQPPITDEEEANRIGRKVYEEVQNGMLRELPVGTEPRMIDRFVPRALPLWGEQPNTTPDQPSA